jgi:hypothetical protein
MLHWFAFDLHAAVDDESPHTKRSVADRTKISDSWLTSAKSLATKTALFNHSARKL